jgi:two-component system, LytTR family, response regulator
MKEPLRLIVADDERPARALLIDLLETFPDVEVVGEAATGPDAVRLIERAEPDLALLDLNMPELDGIGVVRVLPRDAVPLVAFVTAYDEYAVRAFEVNAIDYLLKPVSSERMRETLDRARERLAQPEWRREQQRHLTAASAQYDEASRPAFLERIPVREREEVLLLPVEQVASIVAEGELLRITTVRNEQHVISYRLKDLEGRLDPARFVRLSRGTLANVRMIARFSPMPGGIYIAVLANKQELQVSRSQARVLRDQLMRL